MTGLWAYYLEPLGGGLFHLYNPQNHKCYKALLRGSLKKGRRAQTSLKPGQVLYITPMMGVKTFKIMSKTTRFMDPIDLASHQCDYDTHASRTH